MTRLLIPCIVLLVSCSLPEKEPEAAYDFYVDLDEEIAKLKESELRFVKYAELNGQRDTSEVEPEWDSEFELFRKADVNQSRSSAFYDLETNKWGSELTYHLTAKEEAQGTQWVRHVYSDDQLTKVEYYYEEQDVLRKFQARLVYEPGIGLYQEVRTELKGSGVQKTKVQLAFIAP
jgi:hypothetical protein